MPGRHRATLLVLAVIAAIAAIIIVPSLGSDEGDDTEPPTPPPAATTTTGGATTATPGQPGPKRSAAKTITVRDAKPVGGVQRLNFDKGTTVLFTVKSDVADEIHVHGYDLSKDVAAGGSATFRFKAEADGIYEIELEQRAVQIAELRIK